jgi:HSP20 family molecular chaperone IbpA
MSVGKLDSNLSQATNAQKAALQAERDANDRIRTAKKKIEEVDAENQQRIQQLKDEYVRESATEQGRQSVALESQRLKGYENLRSLQQSNAKQIQSTAEKAESEIEKLEFEASRKTSEVEDKTKSNLENLEKQSLQTTEFRKKELELNQEQLAKDAADRLAYLKQKQDLTVAEQDEIYQAELGQKTQVQRQTLERNRELFDKNFKSVFDQQGKELGRIQSKAANELASLQQSNSEKLESYATRSGDPFYRLKQSGAQVTESGEAYVVRTTVPRHEQSGFNVSVRDDQIVITGNRRNKESLELAPGRTQSTSSFQSFTETFPIRFPVDARQATRSVEGDEITYTFPKKGYYDKSAGIGGRKPAPERVVQNKPNFPDNLSVPEFRPGSDAGRKPLTSS